MAKTWGVRAFAVLMVWASSVGVTYPHAQEQAQASSISQPSAFVGSDLFRTYCASCHGTGAKGDGPIADMLKKRPADLTLFARNNNGVYPADLVGKIIDGRQAVPGHGGKDMPVWGDAFKDAGGGGDDASIKARVMALVGHLESVQVK